jgi:Na+:H+ antiporter, NhaA family
MIFGIRAPGGINFGDAAKRTLQGTRNRGIVEFARNRVDEAEFSMTVPERGGGWARLLRSPAAGGMALLAATLVALVWSNGSGRYEAVTGAPVFGVPVTRWVNDGLMTLFFLAVGLEIRWELTEGALGSPRLAAGPAVAAWGGMVVPALIYMIWVGEDPAALRGWAVPVATDIAFAMAAVAALGRLVPAGLKTFLTALAIIDDLLAILVIAVFYSSEPRWGWLGASVALSLGLLTLRWLGLRVMPIYLLGGIGLWICVRKVGVHPTMAGVVLAFLVPGGEAASGLERRLGPWVTWLVLPLFGLANGGLVLSGIRMDQPVAWAVAGALLLGKPLGVFGATFLAVRLKMASLPLGVGWRQLLGVAVLCGIGFTMSLFIGDLAFAGTELHQAAKLGVFAGSVASALVGMGVLAWASWSDAGAR